MQEMDLATAQQMVERLQQQLQLQHPQEPVECLQTHISWILLAGERAYKLSKPLNLGFLDYSTLALRRQGSEEELRLNRRTAPPTGNAAGLGIVASANTHRRFRSLFISDVHLGTRGCQADQLLDFLRWNDADTIYLVGDIVDGWQLRSTWHWPQAHNFTAQARAARIWSAAIARRIRRWMRRWQRGLRPILHRRRP